MKKVFVTPDRLKSFINTVLLKTGVRKDVARHVTNSLVETSLRGVDSHGIRLFPHYIEAVRGGRINPDPVYRFKKTSASTGLLDADHTFGHAAAMEGAGKAVEMAEKGGTGHIAVFNSTHFGAAACYALEIARHDMIGMSFTNTDSLIRTYGGKRPFLGNNPIAFAAPCDGEEPFCLDMATSIVTFNKVRQLRESGHAAPAGIGADKSGRETQNPRRISMLLPVGGYKGCGLSMVFEILTSLLTGMPYGPHIPKMFSSPMSARRFLGHFVIALNIESFQKKSVFKKRLALMMNELRREPARDRARPVMVAGDPEKEAYEERVRKGIPMSEFEYDQLIGLAAGNECIK